MDRAELIVRNRVNKLGASETSIQRQGSDSILVQIPGVKNAEEALKVIGSTGQLEFVEVASDHRHRGGCRRSGAGRRQRQAQGGDVQARS